MLWTILVIILILALIGAPGMPWYGDQGHPYGWGPSGLLSLILVILLILLLTGRM